MIHNEFGVKEIDVFEYATWFFLSTFLCSERKIYMSFENSIETVYIERIGLLGYMTWESVSEKKKQRLFSDWA